MALSALFFSVAALCVKLTHSRVPVLQITLWRSSLSWAASAAIARSQGIAPLFGSRASRALLLSRGAFGATAMTCYYFTLTALPLADAVTLFFFNGPLTAVLARLVRGEPLSGAGAAGCLASFAGVVLLAHPPFLFGGHAEWGPARVAGTAAGLASALLAAGAFISIRCAAGGAGAAAAAARPQHTPSPRQPLVGSRTKAAAPAAKLPRPALPRRRAIGKSEPPLIVALAFHTCTLALSAAPLACGWPERAVLPGPGDAGLLTAVAACSFCAQLYMTRGYQLESATRASAASYTQVRGGEGGGGAPRQRAPGGGPVAAPARAQPHT
jgi:drug/metabolite transporter (DMT)-like permease